MTSLKWPFPSSKHFNKNTKKKQLNIIHNSNDNMKININSNNNDDNKQQKI